MKKELQLVLIVLVSIWTASLHSQNKSKVNIFLDENFETLTETEYNKKCQSFIYFCRRYENDSIIFNIIREGLKFGKLNREENSQIRLLLEKETEKKLSNKTLVITFRDILYGYNEYIKDRRPNHHLELEYYNNRLKSYNRNQKKCIKKDAKYNRERLYFYNDNNGYTYKPTNFNWVHSSNILNTVLFKNYSGMVILKPDGHYFYFVEIYEKFIEELLEAENWSLFIKDYEFAKMTFASNPFGMLTNVTMPDFFRRYKGVSKSSLKCYYKGDY